MDISPLLVRVRAEVKCIKVHSKIFYLTIYIIIQSGSKAHLETLRNTEEELAPALGCYSRLLGSRICFNVQYCRQFKHARKISGVSYCRGSLQILSSHPPRSLMSYDLLKCCVRGCLTLIHDDTRRNCILKRGPVISIGIPQPLRKQVTMLASFT